MIPTGIFIRVQIDGKWQSSDVGDPKLNAEQVWRWLATMTKQQRETAVEMVMESIQHEKSTSG